jgi:hypothetical protein
MPPHHRHIQMQGLEHCHRQRKKVEMNVTNRTKKQRLDAMMAYSVLKLASEQKDELKIQAELDEDSDDSAKTLPFDGSGDEDSAKTLPFDGCGDEDSEDSAKTLLFDGFGDEKPDVKPDNHLPSLAQLPPTVVVSVPPTIPVAPIPAAAHLPPSKLLTDPRAKKELAYFVASMNYSRAHGQFF